MKIAIASNHVPWTKVRATTTDNSATRDMKGDI